jgi:hypothetical protein
VVPFVLEPEEVVVVRLAVSPFVQEKTVTRLCLLVSARSARANSIAFTHTPVRRRWRVVSVLSSRRVVQDLGRLCRTRC